MSTLLNVVLLPFRLVFTSFRWVLGEPGASERPEPRLLETGSTAIPIVTETPQNLRRPTSRLEARAISLVEDALEDFSTELTSDLESKLRGQTDKLLESISERLANLGGSVKEMSRESAGRVDLLHGKMEELRDNLEPRMDSLDADTRRARASLSGLRSTTTTLREDLKKQSKEVDLRLAEAEATVATLKDSVSVRLREFEHRFESQLKTLQLAHKELEQESRKTREIVGERVMNVSRRFGDLGLEINRLTFEAEEILNVGRGHVGFFGRIAQALASPFVIARVQKRAMRHAFEVQKLLMRELFTVGDDLKRIARDVCPSWAPYDPIQPPSTRPRFDFSLLDDDTDDQDLPQHFASRISRVVRQAAASDHTHLP